MRISDWSSDVCSSDLDGAPRGLDLTRRQAAGSECLQAIGAKVQLGAALGLAVDSALEGLPVFRSLRLQHNCRSSNRVARARLSAPPPIVPSGRPAPACPGPSGRSPGSRPLRRSEEHTSELQSLMRISSAVFCLNK